MIALTAAWSFLTGSKLGRWAAIAVAVAVGVLTMRSVWRADGRDDIEHDQREDFIDRTSAGRSAGRAAERDSATMTADERLAAVRGNDGAWE